VNKTFYIKLDMTVLGIEDRSDIALMIETHLGRVYSDVEATVWKNLRDFLTENVLEALSE